MQTSHSYPEALGCFSRTKERQRQREEKRKEEAEGQGKRGDPCAWLPLDTAASLSICVSYFKQVVLVWMLMNRALGSGGLEAERKIAAE